MVITNRMSVSDWLYKIFVNICMILMLYYISIICIGHNWTSICSVKIVPFVIAIIVVYVYNYIYFCKMTLYDDYIELTFPMRFSHRKKIIKYSCVNKVSFAVPKSGMFYRIYAQNTLCYYRVDVYEIAKIRSTLSFFYEKGVSIHFYSNESKKKYASWL